MIPGRKAQHDGIESEVTVEADKVTLGGTLALPDKAAGIVLFAHGSGSSRHSPRNRHVAQVLQSKGVGTLLFDLLTSEEESIDQYNALRFDIPFLAKRLVRATEWILRRPDTKDSLPSRIASAAAREILLILGSAPPQIIIIYESMSGMRTSIAQGGLFDSSCFLR